MVLVDMGIHAHLGLDPDGAEVALDAPDSSHRRLFLLDGGGRVAVLQGDGGSLHCVSQPVAHIPHVFFDRVGYLKSATV